MSTRYQPLSNLGADGGWPGHHFGNGAASVRRNGSGADQRLAVIVGSTRIVSHQSLVLATHVFSCSDATDRPRAAATCEQEA